MKQQPQNADALLLLGASLRQQGDAIAARNILEPFVHAQPDSVFAHYELGVALGLLGNHREAVDALARAVDLASTFVDAWCALGDELAILKEKDCGANQGHDRSAETDSLVDEAERSLRDGQTETAVHLLRNLRERQPTNARVIKLLADSVLRMGSVAEAEDLLARCLDLSPDYEAARFRYAVVLLAQEKGHAAFEVIEELARCDPTNTIYLELRAAALYEIGDFHRAIAQYEEILNDGRVRPGGWISYGRALRAIGRKEDCVAAFRKAVEILPAYAEGYRTLATVKTIQFEPLAIDRLRDLLARPGQLLAVRAQLHFALGKALEDWGQYADSFENYRQSQALRSVGNAGSVDRFIKLVGRTKAVCTPAFFRERAAMGCATADPIFIVGMPRSGSTLVQEILAAHPAIERTGELRDLMYMTERLREQPAGSLVSRHYPDLLQGLDANRLRSLGEEYLERTRPRRKSGLPFFTDKLPENFIHTGMIHLILPNARIIDVRRHPLDCCLSCFKNYFPEAPLWSHSLQDLGRYYAGYVEMMSHFDDVLPGRIHRILYEELIEDPEREVRRLLDHLGLPFDAQCLRFYEKEQAILTTSVEQARRPIYRSGVGNSRNYEPWLEPLKSALGYVLDVYPQVPKFYPRLQAAMTLRLA